MSNKELAADIRKTAKAMEATARRMSFYAGFNMEQVGKAIELEGAARIARQWARRISRRKT